MKTLMPPIGWRSVVREAVDQAFCVYANRRTRVLDRLSPAKLQSETLLRLLKRAEHTRFGRDHGFGEIRTVQGYQQSVSLRDYEAYWTEYWQPMPKPGWHDLFALTKRGEAVLEGDLHPFMAHLQYFKDVLALPRPQFVAVTS